MHGVVACLGLPLVFDGLKQLVLTQEQSLCKVATTRLVPQSWGCLCIFHKVTAGFCTAYFVIVTKVQDGLILFEWLIRVEDNFSWIGLKQWLVNVHS